MTDSSVDSERERHFLVRRAGEALVVAECPWSRGCSLLSDFLRNDTVAVFAERSLAEAYISIAGTSR